MIFGGQILMKSRRMKHCVMLSGLLILMVSVAKGEGYSIDIQIKGLSDTSVYIGYHFAEKKYVKDTLRLNANGKVSYRGDEHLPGGVYLLVFPSMNFIEFIVGDDQDFSITTDINDPLYSLKFGGSDTNSRFLEYQKFMREKQTIAGELRQSREEYKSIPDSVEAINGRLQEINDQIEAYWDRLIRENSDTFLGHLVKGLRNPEVPDFEVPEGTENIDSVRWVMGYHFNRDHFLDNIEFSDERLLRTPVVHSKLDQYVNRVLIQQPDSIIPPLHKLVDRSRANDKVFQYVVVFLLNNFLQSNIMGMDAVYVDIAEKYYLSGEATWADSSFMANLEDRVSKIKPNLISKTGKDLIMETSTGEWASLHEVNAKYTVLYFWEPNCGHCKQVTPLLYDIYKKYKEKGLEVFAVYTQDNGEEWHNYLRENGFDWINVYDPTQMTYFRYYYDIYSTPVLYLLDEQKVIIAKRISVESLGRMLETLL